MNPYIELAKKSVEEYIKTGTIISPPKDLPDSFLKEKSGVFVTLEKEGSLRGCIGTYLPTKENIAQEIISNALSAALHDPRFPPVRKEELPRLSYTVYILDKPERITDLKQLDPKKYGILVKSSSSGRSGLLLPDLKGIDTTEKQILIACQKAGSDSDKEKLIIFRFKAKKYP